MKDDSRWVLSELNIYRLLSDTFILDLIQICARIRSLSPEPRWLSELFTSLKVNRDWRQLPKLCPPFQGSSNLWHLFQNRGLHFHQQTAKKAMKKYKMNYWHLCASLGKSWFCRKFDLLSFYIFGYFGVSWLSSSLNFWDILKNKEVMGVWRFWIAESWKGENRF